MSTALVRGSLMSFGFGGIQGVQGRLLFRPSGPAVGPDGVVFASMDREAVISSNGTRWDAYLQTTHDIRPLTWYTPVIQWFQSADGTSWLEQEFPQWRLFVPPEGGWFDDLVQTQWNPNLVYRGATPPDGQASEMTNNSMWLNTDSSSPNYGLISQWRN